MVKTERGRGRSRCSTTVFQMETGEGVGRRWDGDDWVKRNIRKHKSSESFVENCKCLKLSKQEESSMCSTRTSPSMNTDLGSATVCHTLCNSSLTIDKHVLASVQLSQTDNIKTCIMGNKDCIDPYWCTTWWSGFTPGWIYAGSWSSTGKNYKRQAEAVLWHIRLMLFQSFIYKNKITRV